MQRQKMSLLKAQLRRPKYYENSNKNFLEDPGKNKEANANVENANINLQKNNDIRVKYEPGVILKISFENPIESDKIFKVRHFLFILYYIIYIYNIYLIQSRVRCKLKMKYKSIILSIKFINSYLYLILKTIYFIKIYSISKY